MYMSMDIPMDTSMDTSSMATLSIGATLAAMSYMGTLYLNGLQGRFSRVLTRCRQAGHITPSLFPRMFF